MTDMALVPTTNRQELEAMSLAERVALEDAFGTAHELIRSLNDAEIGRLAEAGMSQRAIAEAAGLSRDKVRLRLARIGLAAEPVHNDSSGDIPQDVPQNGDGPAEVVDGEVVEDDPNDRPERHLPDIEATDAHLNLRTTALRWFDWGRDVEQLLEDGAVANPKSKDDKAAIKREAAHMAAIARRLKGAF